MSGIVEVISTSFDKAKRLVVKVLYQGKLINGKGDLREPLEVSPYGVDSAPIKGKRALFHPTSVYGKNYISGYLNTARMAQPGEFRSFSTDTDGQLQAYMWLKSQGNIMELNGNDNWAVKYTELKADMDAFQKSHNDLVTAFNAHTHTAPGGLTGAPTPIPTQIPATPDTTDFSNIKNSKIKTNS